MGVLAQTGNIRYSKCNRTILFFNNNPASFLAVNKEKKASFFTVIRISPQKNIKPGVSEGLKNTPGEVNREPAKVLN